MRATHRGDLQEPLAAEFACSRAFAAHCLAQPVWEGELARSGIDLWITATALAHGFDVGEVVLGPRTPAPGVRVLILILAGAMALEHIAVAQTVVLTAFAITFGAVMLGLAIAFGIGGSRLVERWLDQQFAKPAGPRPDDVTHV